MWLIFISDNRYAPITNLYIPECLASEMFNSMETSNKEEAIMDVTNDETNGSTDQKSEYRKILLGADRAKEKLLKEYFQYYCTLWPTTNDRVILSFNFVSFNY